MKQVSDYEATCRLPFAGRHQARLNVNDATGTEPVGYREKATELPPLPRLSERLWSILIGNYARNGPRILSSGLNISDVWDWLAERGGFELSVLFQLCFAKIGR